MIDSRAFRSGNAGILPLLAAALLLGGCVSNTYMGIPLTGDADDPELRSLAQRAAAGDKQAQLDLGIRYEEGRGVPVRVDRAKQLYASAAVSDGGMSMLHIPSGKNGSIGTTPIYSGAERPGLPQAQQRLRFLENRSSIGIRKRSIRGTFVRVPEQDFIDICPVAMSTFSIQLDAFTKESACASFQYIDMDTNKVYYTINYFDNTQANPEDSEIYPHVLTKSKYKFMFNTIDQETGRYVVHDFHYGGKIIFSLLTSRE